MENNKMLKTLKTLVLLATISCGYTSNLNNVSTSNIYTNKITCTIINSVNDNNYNVINNITITNGNNSDLNSTNNIEYIINNNLSNNNFNKLNNISNQLSKQINTNNKSFINKKRNRETTNNDDNDKNNNKLEENKKYYNDLFGNNYNNSYYYDSIKQYINDNQKSNKYIIDIYKMFATFAKNIKYAIYDYHFNNEYKDNIKLTLNDLKRYATLFDKFKVKPQNNSWEYINKYKQTQKDYNISINEFYNYVVNKTAKLYDQTINALRKSIEKNESYDKQNEIVENSKEVLCVIITSFENTDRDLNDESQNHKVLLCDKDRTWVIIEQLEVDKHFINLEKNLIKKFNEYNNKLMLFLDKIMTNNKNNSIVISGINDTKIRNNISVLLDKLNIENCSNYKEIKDFFTSNSLELQTKEYFKLFKQYSNNLKDILIDKINKTQASISNTNSFEVLIKKNSFDNFVYPYIKIIKDTLENVTINNSIVYNKDNTLNTYNFHYLSKLYVDYFL